MRMSAAVGIVTGVVAFLITWLVFDHVGLSIAVGAAFLLVGAIITPIFVAEGDDELDDTGRVDDARHRTAPPR